MQSSNEPVKISVPFAQNGDKQVIPVASQVGVADGRASYNDGFPPITRIDILAGGVPPFGTDFNGILYAITNMLRWQNSGGVPKFDSAFSASIGGYPKGAVLQKATGIGWWISTVENNTSNPDGASPAGWVDAFAGVLSGLGTMSAQNANSVAITGGSISGIADLAIADGGTGASTKEQALANLGGAPLASPAFTGAPTAPTPAQATNNTQLATTAFVRAAIAALVDSSPGTLDTLNELAAALGDDPNFATTMTNALAGKQPLDATLTALAALVTAADKLIYSTGSDTFATTDLTAKARSLLGQVDEAAMRSFLGLIKQTGVTDTAAGRVLLVGAFGLGTNNTPLIANFADDIQPGFYRAYGSGNASATPGAPAGSHNGALTVFFGSGINDAGFKAVIAVENTTSSSGKVFVGRKSAAGNLTWTELWHTGNVSSFVQTIFDDPDAASVRSTIGAAPLASPALTGTPTAPTAAVGTNTTQLATTEFTKAQIAADVPTTIAGQAVGAVGTYGFFMLYGGTTGVNIAPGTTIAGSNLRYAAAGWGGTTAPTGTWRVMGAAADADGADTNSITLCMRIS